MPSRRTHGDEIRGTPRTAIPHLAIPAEARSAGPVILQSDADFERVRAGGGAKQVWVAPSPSPVVSALEPGRRIELLTYALREGPDPCLGGSGGALTLLNRPYQIACRIVPVRDARIYGMDMG